MASHHVLKHVKSKSKINLQYAQTKVVATLEFQFKFQSYCLENGCTFVPHVEHLEDLKDIQRDKEIPLLIIVTQTPESQNIEKLTYKNYVLENGTMLALERCLKENMTPTVLKLEFCHLTAEQIEILAQILLDNVTITEVSVNGNPNTEQNFDLLLKDTKLLILSLKCCSIDKFGMEKISNELNKPFETTLLHLNLASNLLFDEGIDHVSSFLRINRTLVSLNLADNKIYNEGCLKLIQPLQKFSLELPEIIIRREIRFAMFKKELELAACKETSVASDAEISKHSSATVAKNSLTQTTKRSPSAKLSKTGSLKGSKHSSKEKPALLSQETLSRGSSSIKQDKDNHPFVQDSYEDDMEIYCKGNDTLINLGLSYNRISKEGLNCIIQMLYYQRNIFPNDKVISRISLEGNDLMDCEQELIEFDDLINNRTRKSSIASTNTKRSSTKKGSSKMSATQH